MAEIQQRSSASRGRGSGRTGRGGYSSRGSRTTSRTVETALPTVQPSLAEQGEIGLLKKTYATELATLKELFPDWTDDDLVLALEDTDGDLPTTIERISEGNVYQFSDVKKKTKEKIRPKKDSIVASEIAGTSTRGRGRGGSESVRGGRGRGSERSGRGRGAGRGGSVANGTSRSVGAAASTPTIDTPSISAPVADASAATDAWSQAASDAAPEPVSTKTILENTTIPEVPKSSLIPEGTKKSWASMLSGPKPLPAVPAIPKQPIQAQELIAATEPVPDETLLETSDGVETIPAAPLIDGLPVETLPTPPQTADPSITITPSKDKLTEDNLENVPDASNPIATETVASTRDASSVVGPGTPYAAPQQASTAARPILGGYATSAWKAAGNTGRSTSFQKRIMEQREAVVMPNNHAVDRAAVQFGSMGLNGDNSKPLDVDDDREETQTRAPVAHSPPSQPRASLPPSSHPAQAVPPESTANENNQTSTQPPGIPTVGQTPSAATPSTAVSNGTQQPAYSQYGRYGAAGPLNQESQAPTHKSYDSYSHQSNYHQGQDSSSLYQHNNQAGAHSTQSQSQSAYNQGPSDYSSYGGDQQRYQHYYGGAYGQQNPSSQHEEAGATQKSGGAFGSSEGGYGASQPAPPSTQSRFSENQSASGHNTPAPTNISSHGIGGHPQQMHHAQGQHQGQGTGGYPYGHPYNYGGGSYNYGGGSYMNQYSNNYYGHGYGAPYGGKGSMYGQPQQGYGISPQTSYEQTSSPANTGAFTGNTRGNDNSLSGSLGDFGRSGSTQPSQQASLSGSYPGHEAYGRNAGTYGQNHGQQQMEDPLKSLGGESKSGPSPAVGQPGRTGSATNMGSYSQGQSNYHQQQSQQGFGGGYPNHLNQLHGNQGSGYGIGGLGGSHQASTQNQQGGGYGGYGGFGNNNYHYGGRGGWGSNNYGGH